MIQCLRNRTLVYVLSFTMFLWLINSPCFAFEWTGMLGGKPRIQDSGYEISRVLGRVFWINDKEILFSGVQRDAKYEGGYAPYSKQRLFIWNTQTNTVRWYADSERVCFHDGNIRYGAKFGPMGQENEMPERVPPEELLKTRDSYLDALDCRRVRKSELRPPQAGKRRDVAVLRETDGYIDLGQEYGPHYNKREADDTIIGNLKLYRPNGTAAIVLPIIWKEEVRAWNIKYSLALNVYVLTPTKDKDSPRTSSVEWPQRRSQPVYAVNPSGTVNTYKIPTGLSGEAKIADLTKNGVVFYGWGRKRGSGGAGLYLLQSGVVRKILAGHVNDLAVNRDGCRVAVGINTGWMKSGYQPIRLLQINVCQ